MKLLPLLLLAFASAASAQMAQLTAELVPSDIHVAPGQSAIIGVQLTHAEHSHSYWVNPGGPGKATTFKWTLPAGVTVSAPKWSTPKKIEFSGFQTYSYEGATTVLFEIKAEPTAVAGPISLLADALVCSTSCKPEKAEAKGTLALDAQPIAPDAKAKLAAAQAALPTTPKGWKIKAEKDAAGMRLRLQPEDGNTKVITAAYFFSDAYPDQVTDSEKPQPLQRDRAGYTLELPAAADTAPPTKLTGIFTLNDGTEQSIAIDLTFGGAAAEPAKAPAPTPTSNAPSATASLSLGSALLFAFLGGLILNIMPCVFPVIGIKVMSFVQQAGEDKKKVFMHGAAYTMGVLVCFWALASIAIAIGRTWGFQLQEPRVVLVLCFFFMALALNMAGVFEFGLSATGVGGELQQSGGLKGAFFQGLLATVVATPCTGPFLGSVLPYAFSLPPVQSLLLFTVIGLGLASPYLLLSLMPGLVKLLPRPGAWMESFKQGMSFLLFGTVGYLLWTFAGMVEEWHLLMTIFALVLVAMACWIYGRWGAYHATSRARSIAYGLTAACVLGAFYLGWPQGTAQASTASTTSTNGLTWEAWSPEKVAELRAAGKPVYVDFTARWCATCQFNKRLYKDESIASLIRAKGITLMKADYTNYDERIKHALRDEFHQEAVPVNVFYAPGQDKALVLDAAPLTAAGLNEAFALVK